MLAWGELCVEHPHGTCMVCQRCFLAVSSVSYSTVLLVQGAASGPRDQWVILNVCAKKLQPQRAGMAHDLQGGVLPIFPRGVEWLPLLIFGLAFFS